MIKKNDNTLPHTKSFYNYIDIVVRDSENKEESFVNTYIKDIKYKDVSMFGYMFDAVDIEDAVNIPEEYIVDFIDTVVRMIDNKAEDEGYDTSRYDTYHIFFNRVHPDSTNFVLNVCYVWDDKAKQYVMDYYFTKDESCVGCDGCGCCDDDIDEYSFEYISK